jgi:uncharacterized linocin/CFP29 family protein
MNNMTQTMDTNLRNRNQIPWDEEIWNRIDRAVHDECKRTKIATKFLPMYVPSSPNQLTIPSDTVVISSGISPDRESDRKLMIDEVATTPLIELVTEFKLTVQQAEREAELGTAVTLATRAANLLSQGQDIIIFQGQNAIAGKNPHPLFRDRKVIVKSGSGGLGLVNAPEADSSNPKIQIVNVPVLDPNETPPRWGENTFGAVSQSYSRLQSGDGLAQAHYGPYVCVLNFQPYADTYAPLATTLIIPADRIKPLVTEMGYDNDMPMNGSGMGVYQKDIHTMQMYGKYPQYYGTGTIPRFNGIFLSLGGNTMDLVIGMDAKTEYTNQDKDGNYCFRVYERFALRLKDPTSTIRLEFEGDSVIAPKESISADSEISITVGIQPIDASNQLQVHYRVNQGESVTLIAKPLQNDPFRRIQYFRAYFPAFRTGDRIEYAVICRCAGRQVPPPKLKQNTGFLSRSVIPIRSQFLAIPQNRNCHKHLISMFFLLPQKRYYLRF